MTHNINDLNTERKRGTTFILIESSKFCRLHGFVGYVGGVNAWVHGWCESTSCMSQVGCVDL